MHVIPFTGHIFPLPGLSRTTESLEVARMHQLVDAETMLIKVKSLSVEL